VRIAVGAAVVASYAALVVWLTWPLAEHAATNYPMTVVTSSADIPLVTWAAAHETRTLFSGPAALADAGIYHPTPNSLYYGEAGFGVLPLFAPVFLATGNPTLAMNIVFLGGVVLTAAAIHAAAHRWTESHAGGFVAGVTFVTTPWVLWSWMPSAPNYAVVFYLPFIMLLAASVTPTWRTTIGLGILIALQGLSTLYLAVATCVPLAMLAAFRCTRGTTRIAGLRLAASVAMASLLLVPPYWGYLQLRRANPNLEKQSIYAGQRFLPTSLPGDLFSVLRPTALPIAALAIVAAGLLCRSIAPTPDDTTRRREGWRHAGLWAIAGLYLSLRPHVVIDGMPVTLPHVVLAPVYAALRGAHRLGVTTLIAGSLLAGIAYVECVARLPSRHAALGRVVSLVSVVALLLLTYFQPMPAFSRMLDPRHEYPTVGAPIAGPIYAEIERSHGALLELPVCPSATSHAVAMYLSIGHRRPLLNGYNGYYPADFAGRMALACRLPDPEALAELARTTDLEMILVHTPFLGTSRRVRARAPYGCPADPGGPTDYAPGAEARAWRAAGAPGARRDLQLVRATSNGDLLFRVVRDAPAASVSNQLAP
jgi:hypothetical protein